MLAAACGEGDAVGAGVGLGGVGGQPVVYGDEAPDLRQRGCALLKSGPDGVEGRGVDTRVAPGAAVDVPVEGRREEFSRVVSGGLDRLARLLFLVVLLEAQRFNAWIVSCPAHSLTSARCLRLA